MGRRWAWMGVMGACALLSGCRERERQEQAAPVAARAPAPARPSESPSPERISTAPAAGTGAQPLTAPAAQPTAAAAGAAQAQAHTSARANAPAVATASQPAAAAPAGASTGSTAGTAGTAGTASAAAQTASQGQGRVMIGLEAVQAREDEAWHEGAAKAARAAGQNDSVPLDRVVIATGTVDGRVTRVDKSTLHLKDTEGNVYELRIDKRSRGVRGGQSMPLRQLEEGTSVRASFDLVGDDSIARDIEVRR